jgi:GAF domain-containing protein
VPSDRLSVVVRAVAEAEGSGAESTRVAVVQDLQLALGEGPCVDAWMSGEVVLEPDLADPAVVRWLAFAQAGVEAGVRAVFAVPLRLGAAGIGVLVLYRDCVGVLSADELAYGLVLADVALQERADRRPAERDNPREDGAWRFFFGMITIALWRNGPARSKVTIGSV